MAKLKNHKHQKPYYWQGSVDKCFTIIRELSQAKTLSAQELALRVDLDRSAVFRFLATLRDLGYVIANEGKFRLSYKFFEIGTCVVNELEIKRFAVPFMQELNQLHDETVNLACLVDTDIIFLHKIDSSSFLRMDFAVGMCFPAYCTALGKVILAYMPFDEVKKLFDNYKFIDYTASTINDIDTLLMNLNEIRNEGFAIDDKEFDAHLRCIAAPIFDFSGQVKYSISVSGPSSRITKKRIKSITTDLVKVCKQLSHSLGFKADENPFTKNLGAL